VCWGCTCDDLGSDKTCSFSLASTDQDHAMLTYKPREHMKAELCRTWLDECLATHPGCGLAVPTELPNRIIQLSEDSRFLRLVMTRGLRARYVALSHCWGDVHPLTTTASNIESHLRGRAWAMQERILSKRVITPLRRPNIL
jgi:hypothetical protein